jgi:1-acyl-sn-glycerol-3-phosphate acyltransferase
MFFALTAKRIGMTWTVRTWNRLVLRFLGVKVRTHFESTYSPEAPCLIVTNHQSHLDIPAVFEALSGHIRMVAKAELFRIPFFGWCLHAAEFIPIERGNRDAGRKAVANIKDRIQSGLQVWVAPEGTRSSDGKLQKFKTGSFSVAIEAGVPVQPIVVKGAIDVISKHESFPKPGLTIDLYVLPQISTEGYRPDERHKLAEIARNAMLQYLPDGALSAQPC